MDDLQRSNWGNKRAARDQDMISCGGEGTGKTACLFLLALRLRFEGCQLYMGPGKSNEEVADEYPFIADGLRYHLFDFPSSRRRPNVA